jgi:mevalonate kinase
MRLYAWVENGLLFTTEDKNLAPANAIELEVESPDDVIYDGTQIRLKTEEEKLIKEKQKKLEELKRYVASLLKQTDYIIIRIIEAETLGNKETAKQLRRKYATQLQQRQAIRQWNKQMKRAIRKAKTLEELRSVELNFTGFQKEV